MKQQATAHFVGKIIDEIEVKTSSKGSKWLSFRVAIPFFKKGANGEMEQSASFFTLSAFGNMAEEIGANYTKGSLIDATTNISNGSYVKNNVKTYTTNFAIYELGEVEVDKESIGKEPNTKPKEVDIPSDNPNELPF